MWGSVLHVRLRQRGGGHWRGFKTGAEGVEVGSPGGGGVGGEQREWKGGWGAERVGGWVGPSRPQTPSRDTYQEKKRLGVTQAAPLRLALAAARPYPHDQRSNNQQIQWEHNTERGAAVARRTANMYEQGHPHPVNKQKSQVSYAATAGLRGTQSSMALPPLKPAPQMSALVPREVWRPPQAQAQSPQEWPQVRPARPRLQPRLTHPPNRLRAPRPCHARGHQAPHGDGGALASDHCPRPQPRPPHLPREERPRPHHRRAQPSCRHQTRSPPLAPPRRARRHSLPQPARPRQRRRLHGERLSPSGGGHDRGQQRPLPRHLPHCQPRRRRRRRQRPSLQRRQQRPQRSSPHHSRRPSDRRLPGRQRDPPDGPHRPCRGHGRALSHARGCHQGPAAARRQLPPQALPLRRRRPAHLRRQRPVHLRRPRWRLRRQLPPGPSCDCSQHPPAHALVPDPAASACRCLPLAIRRRHLRRLAQQVVPPLLRHRPQQQRRCDHRAPLACHPCRAQRHARHAPPHVCRRPHACGGASAENPHPWPGERRPQ